MPRQSTRFVYLIGLVNLVLFAGELWLQVYPYWAMGIQIITIISLILLCKPKINVNHKEFLLLCGLFILAFAVRIYQVDAVPPGMLGDEITIAKTSEAVFNSVTYVPFSTDNLGHPTLLLYANGLFFKLFGRSLVALRLSSILLAALTIPIFYLLCRKFFPAVPSLITAALFIFSYAHLIPSRFANEIAAAVFFQTLALLYLVKCFKDKDLSSFCLLGLTIGLGSLTYLSFRTQAILMLAVLAIGSLKLKIKPAFWGVSLLSILLTTYPLISYSLHHPGAVWARVQSISVFNKGLPTAEIVKEIAASTWNLHAIFIGQGDPDPRQNPAGTALYDPLTVGLLLLGLIALGKKSPKLFGLLLLFCLPTIINDIFTIEIIPQYHFYGESHPNIFHISSFLPLVYLGVASGLAWLQQKSGKLFPAAFPILLTFLIIPISIINLGRYFTSPVTQFAYVTMGVKELKIAKLIQDDPHKQFYLSPTLLDDAHVQYFANSKKLTRFVNLASDKPFILDPTDDVNLAKRLLASPSADQNIVFDPWQHIEVITNLSLPK